MVSPAIFIFTDAATSPQAGIAIGAFVCLDQRHINEFDTFSITNLSRELENQVTYQKYKTKKSTWSEIKTVIHALESIQVRSGPLQEIEIYTDCKSLCDLLGQRKEKLEKNNFITRSGKILPHAKLYQELYAMVEKFHVQVFKIKGHQPKSQHLTCQEKIFSVLDKLSRKKLRMVLKGG